MSEPSVDDKKKWARLDRQRSSLREGIADVSIAWARLETSMSFLLATLIGGEDTDMGCRLYFAPSNTETRFALVSAAIDAARIRETSKEELPRLWKPIANRLSRNRAARNQIAHGTIYDYADANGNEMRFMPPMFDLARMYASVRLGQKMGMSANDVANIAVAINETQRRVSKFTDAVKAFNIADAVTFQRITRELESRPQADGAPATTVLTAQGRKVQPRPSRG